MAASDSHQAGYRFNKLNASLRVFYDHVKAILPPRRILLAAGLGCVIYSQYLMEQRVTQGQPLELADFWNTVYRLEIVNFDNVLYALPYFIGGALLCALAGLPESWKAPFENWSAHWPNQREAKWRTHLPRILLGAGLIIYLLIQLGRHQYTPIYPILWILALWLFTQVSWMWDKNAGINLSLGLSAPDILWMLGLFAFGIALGAYALEDIPIVIVPDEGSFWEAARAIASREFHPAFFDSGVYTFPMASSIFQGWVLRIFGVNFWGWRFASVLAGVVAVVPLYLLAKEWFGRRTAVAAGVMMLANPYFLSFSRLGYNNSQALFPVTLTVYFWALGTRRGSYFCLWLAGLAAGFGFYTYFSAWLGLVTICLGVLYLRLLRHINWKRVFVIIAFILAAWGATIAPRIVYTASVNFSEWLVYKIFEASFVNIFYGKAYYGEAELSRTMPPIKIGEHHTIFYDPLIYSELITRGTVRTFLSMFNPYIVFEHFVNSGLSGVITPMFLLIGLALSLRYWKQSRFGLPLIWLFGGMLFLSILNSFPPRHTHLVSIIPAMALIAGAGLMSSAEGLSEYLSARWTSLRITLTNGLAAIALLASVYYGAQRYFVAMPELYLSIFEDIVSWIAWRNDKPADLIYLGRTDIAHRVAYLVNVKMVPHGYASMDVNAFSPESSLSPNTPTILFAEVTTQDGISYLQQPPAGFDRPIAYHDKNGKILGYAMTNSPGVNLQPKAGLADGLHSLTDKPVRHVILILLLGMLVTATLGLRNRFAWPRVTVEAGNRDQETEADKSSEGSEGYEVDIRLRIRIPARKQKPPQ